MRSVGKGALLAAAIGALACGALKDMLALQRGLSHEFGTDAISVNVNNGAVLTVLFTNSDAATLASPDRAAFARRVAEYVRDHYAEYGGLARINVGFSRVRQTGVVTVTNNDVPYSFTTQELGAPRTKEAAAKKAAA
jgi:hypothetical protein